MLGVPAFELLDRRVDLAELWGEAFAERLADRLSFVPTPEAAAELLDAVSKRAWTALVDDIAAG